MIINLFQNSGPWNRASNKFKYSPKFSKHKVQVNLSAGFLRIKVEEVHRMPSIYPNKQGKIYGPFPILYS